MRKTRSQTQAEAAIANAGRSSNITTPTVSLPDNTSNSNQQSINSNSRPAAAPTSNIQVATVSGMKRNGPQAPDNFKIKECEEMVNLLRVVELQQILSFLSISFAGRKVDLQRRIINLLHSNYDLLSHKIREVYTQSIAEQQAQQYGPTDPKRMYSHMQMPPVQQNPAAGLPQPGQPAPVGAQAIQGVPPNGPGGGVANNMVPFMNPIPTHIPIHPDVRLKKLAFYDVLGILIKPSSLVPRNTQRIQEVPFYFTLTPQQATEIASNRDIRNSNKIEHAIQVQLRFCLLETSCEQEDCFPPSVSVKVNNKLCQLPNVIPTNRPNVEPKRPPRPVNVTANVKLSPTVTNTITVQWCPDYTRGYCIAVYLVKKLTSAQLLHRMKTKGVKPADYTRGLIKEKLTEDADCEIATTMLKVSLNCPLGKMKMSIPCRASTCSHLQCFDASLFLQMNERKPTWNCPVCDKPAIYDNLVIDGYFQEVLASHLLKPDDTEIQLHKDGSWSTHSLRNEAQIIDTPTKPVEKVEVISDDIEVITTEDVKMLKSAPPPPAISNDQPTSTTTNDTVDLTLSDSDDDMPLAKRRPALKQSAAANATNSANSVSTSNSNGNGTNGGNANANNQRNAFAQQQRTDADAGIISLDSPSPPNSPAHSDRENQSTQKLLKRVFEEVKLGASSATAKRKKILPQKPFSEVHEFSEFEAKIQNSENKYNDLVAELQTIICASTTKFIKMAWRKIITDNVAHSYSWQGTKTKTPARALSVTGAVKPFYLKFPNVANNSEFERATINFFQHSSTRLNKKVEYEKQKNTRLQ
ncbi:E3 SUMO-protein ligase PIAS2 isoform X2 [Eurosta solidaginis]|uniref:E3 SUMO-protein ligase PIAS2 isoform X2 n=1 Tax=Eurosta solidaginis TaxID=178769 RepID=UPI00353177E4